MLRLIHTAEGQFFNRTNMITIIKKVLNTPVLIGLMLGLSIIGGALPQIASTGLAQDIPSVVNADTAPKAVKTLKVVLTAYSSTPDQTDDTPFITASGKYVRDGIIANNLLPFGTKVRIPELYGDKVFTVEDRMNRRKSNYHFDIWMEDRPIALDFGVKTAEIEVLEK